MDKVNIISNIRWMGKSNRILIRKRRKANILKMPMRRIIIVYGDHGGMKN